MNKFVLSVLFISILCQALPACAATNIRYSNAVARSHYVVSPSRVTGYNARGRYVSPSVKTHQIKYGYSANGKYTSSSSAVKNGQNIKGVYVPASDKANVIKYGYDKNGKIQATQVAVKYVDDED